MSETVRLDRVEEITLDRVRHVALLARLELGEEEAVRFSRELTGIMTHINKLGELDLEGVEPTSHAIPTANVFREDTARPGLSNDEGLANAPEKDEGCFKVPQII
ncbi:MAG: aspartyl-tRNA(Asn)/glutamyl-tRNA(Gln) amidotransferase subunit [Candidatus Sumerlaeota bacterium]|nr:aspartyl-tRNA(Asn)/glutamyl-tRNA(Gln) amidotransferase subunit [Candidatus Sumerlaeota bacterium]